MKKIFLTTGVFLCMLFFINDIYAQGTITVVDNVITSSGFGESATPDNVVTTIPKTTCITSGSGNSIETHNNTSNHNNVYHKLEVADVNVSSSSTWYNAVTDCEGWSYKGHDDWRLPTQRELILIYTLRDRLTGFSDDTIQNKNVWSATTSEDKAWYVAAGGDTLKGAKGNYNDSIVRCVRDAL